MGNQSHMYANYDVDLVENSLSLGIVEALKLVVVGNIGDSCMEYGRQLQCCCSMWLQQCRCLRL